MRIPGPWNRSLRARLVGYFLLLSSVTVAVVGIVVYARATDDLTKSVFERLNAVAEVKADSLDRWIDEQRRNVVFVGSIPGVGDEARIFLAEDSTPRNVLPPERSWPRPSTSSCSRPPTPRNS